MPKSDVVVVGGGPAGAATALLLARAGVGVTVVERAKFPRRKVCGEYLNAGAARLLDEIGVGPQVRAVASGIAGLRILAAGTEPVTLRFPVTALAIERATLDALLLSEARAAGADVVHGRAEGLVVCEGRVCGVSLASDEGGAEVRARYVVGADGAGSLVARRLGVVRRARAPRRFALGGHYSGLGRGAALIEMYVGSDAYFAINPLDAVRSNVMVVVREQRLAEWSCDVDGGLCGAAADLARGHRSLEAARRIGPRVAVGPLAFDVRRRVAPGALLVGDAAGFLNPFTGQGVFLALSGAVAAAKTIVDALAAPHLERNLFVKYERERRRDFFVRRGLASLVGAVTDIPVAARRATAKLAKRPDAAASLLATLSGTGPVNVGRAAAGVAQLLF